MLFSLEGGLAVGDVPLRAQPQNEHWVDTCFGPEVVRAMADKPISCAGAPAPLGARRRAAGRAGDSACRRC